MRAPLSFPQVGGGEWPPRFEEREFWAWASRAHGVRPASCTQKTHTTFHSPVPPPLPYPLLSKHRTGGQEGAQETFGRLLPLVVTSSLPERWPKAASGSPAGKFSILQKLPGRTGDGRCAVVIADFHSSSSSSERKEPAPLLPDHPNLRPPSRQPADSLVWKSPRANISPTLLPFCICCL